MNQIPQTQAQEPKERHLGEEGGFQRHQKAAHEKLGFFNLVGDEQIADDGEYDEEESREGIEVKPILPGLISGTCHSVSHVLSPFSILFFRKGQTGIRPRYRGFGSYHYFPVPRKPEAISLYPSCQEFCLTISPVLGGRLGFLSRFIGYAKISRQLGLAFSLTIIYACEYHTERNAVRFIARSE